MRYLRGYDAWNFLAISSIQPSRRSLANDAVHRGINGPLATAVAFQAPNAPQQTGVTVLGKRFAVDNAEVLLSAIRTMKRTCGFDLHNGLVEWLRWSRLGAYRAPDSAQPATLPG